MQATEEKESAVCTQERTKKEVWAERMMIDKTKDIHKECEGKGEQQERASKMQCKCRR